MHFSFLPATPTDCFYLPGYHGGRTGFVGIIVPFVLFCISVVMLSIIFTWVFNYTYGSLLIAMVLHTSINAFTGTLINLFPTPMVSNITVWAALIGYGVVALVLVALTRGRLGYEQDEEPDAVTAPT